MPTVTRGGLSKPHDWHSSDYVSEWIAEDSARDPVRRPRLRDMLAATPFAGAARRTVLDVAGREGAVGHLRALRAAGFAPVECRWQDKPHATVAAKRP